MRLQPLPIEHSASITVALIEQQHRTFADAEPEGWTFSDLDFGIDWQTEIAVRKRLLVLCRIDYHKCDRGKSRRFSD